MHVSYVGTRFAGWQIQRRGDTVQGRIQAALAQVLGFSASIVGAGRTDAGVHALGQVAHFRLDAPVATERLRTAVNSLIPGEIRVDTLTRSRAGFHARHDARAKLYRYRLSRVRKPSPLVRPFVGQVTGPAPAVEMMRRAAPHLTGTHDFSCFCGSGSAIRDGCRTVARLTVACRGEEIIFEVEGDGFLRHQVRNMIGTLIEVGRGKRRHDSLSALLRSRDRRRAGPTAPASGLCLVRVRYAPPGEKREAR